MSEEKIYLVNITLEDLEALIKKALSENKPKEEDKKEEEKRTLLKATEMAKALNIPKSTLLRLKAEGVIDKKCYFQHGKTLLFDKNLTMNLMLNTL